MSRFYRKVTKTAGVSPGTFAPVTEETGAEVRMQLFDYDQQRYEERLLQKIEQAFPFKDEPTVTWLIIEGLHNIEILQKIGQAFNIHPLVLEDIHNTNQRPKIEDYQSYLYIVVKMLTHDAVTGMVHGEQISIIQGSNYVILFKEKQGDVFNVIRERIRTQDSRLRKNETDYLAYRLIDTIVDNYFIVLEQLGEDVEVLEAELMESPSQSTVQEIHRLKRELLYIRKSVWPLREVISTILRDEIEMISDTTRVYLRDVYDHTIQVVDTVESFRDMVSGLLDIYMSSMSNKMNEVMKVLTIIATIFIPLTFIAGIYGMNFESMPELKWPFGYAMAWGIMAVTGLIMVIFFKRKNWL